LLLLGTTPAAGASGQTLAVCNFATHNHASPGFSLTPSVGVDRISGTISCLGSLNGRRLHPEPGTIDIVFNYATGDLARLLGGASCLAYSGDGSLTVTLPADGGTLTLSGSFLSSGIGIVGEIHGTLGGAVFQGAAVFLLDPNYLDENCVTKPLEHFITFGGMSLTG
jgi:hypothetical protein